MSIDTVICATYLLEKIDHFGALEFVPNKDDEVPAGKHADPTSFSHLRWMLYGIKGEYILDDKAQRWIGYVEGVLIGRGLMTLEEAKDTNKRAKR